ncbi:MAG: hypothetical protein AAFR93_14255 [Pseudomonadota bacterium]
MPVTSLTRTVRPRAKVYLGTDMIGAGKIELLGNVARLGSRQKAATAMGMTEERAAFLLSSMEACFEAPLLVQDNASDRLTPLGEELLRRYGALQTALDEAAEPFMAWMDTVARSD